MEEWLCFTLNNHKCFYDKHVYSLLLIGSNKKQCHKTKRVVIGLEKMYNRKKEKSHCILFIPIELCLVRGLKHVLKPATINYSIQNTGCPKIQYPLVHDIISSYGIGPVFVGLK